MFKEEGYRLMGAAFEVYNQLFIYMRIARQPVGYLINFGHKGELQWKRFILSDLHGKGGGNTDSH